MRLFHASLALAAFLAPLPALACSVASGYRVPTNLELAGDADLILLGLVTDGEGDAAGPEAMWIEVHPVAVLKGELPAGAIRLPAMIAPDDAVQLSNPYDLKDAHPQSFAGACTRYVFPRGTRVLFFLKQRGGDWHLAGGPFSRSAEDVLGDDAPWLQATRFYVDVAARPPADRPALLAARRDALMARGDDPIARLIAADIDRQLAGPNEPLREDLPPPPDESDPVPATIE